MINMFSTLVILVLLIFATPITIIFDGPIIPGLLAAVAAMSVAIVGLRIRPGEAGFLSTVIRPVALVAAVPAIWMLIQAMPLQVRGSRTRFGKARRQHLGCHWPEASASIQVRHLSHSSGIFRRQQLHSWRQQWRLIGDVPNGSFSRSRSRRP